MKKKFRKIQKNKKEINGKRKKNKQNKLGNKYINKKISINEYEME